jgi:hypothetical protein
VAQELSRIQEIERRQVKTALLLKLISKPSYFDAKTLKQSPTEAQELDGEIREWLIRHVEELQGVHPMDRLLRANRADDRPTDEVSSPEVAEGVAPPPARRRQPAAPAVVDTSSVDTVLEDMRGGLPDEVASAIDAGISDDKRKRIAQYLVINGFAPVGNVRQAPGQKPPVSAAGLEYANMAALNEHSGHVSLSGSMAADLLSGRDTGTSSIDVNLPSD